MHEVESMSIIVLGNWNKRIFTPSWISNHIFKSQKPLEGLINQDDIELGYKCDAITVFPKDSVLEIKIDSKDISLGTESILILNRILHELPHTPIKAIGFNIYYNVDSDTPIIKAVLNSNLKYGNLNVANVKFSRVYSNYVLNVEVALEEKGGKRLVIFNYHYLKRPSLPFNEDLFKIYYLESEKYLENEE